MASLPRTSKWHPCQTDCCGPAHPQIPPPPHCFPPTGIQANQATGGFVKCLGEAAHFTGGSKGHLLICELSPFDLKTSRSKWLRPTGAFCCHALYAVALGLAAILRCCHSLQDGPCRAPEEKQAADRVLILPAPHRQFPAGPGPWCDFSCHCLSGQLPQL